MTTSAAALVPTYLMHGLHVSSHADLRHTTAPQHEQVDVVLVEGPRLDVPSDDPPGDILARLDAPDGRRLYSFAETEHHYLLRFFDAGQATISRQLDHVTWQSHTTSPPDLMPLLFNGAIVSFLLMMRGHGLLHASAVEYAGRGLAFVGRSGLGKSTMASLCCAAGGALLTDDVLRVDVNHGFATARRGAGENRLRRSVHEVLGESGDGVPHRETVDGRTAVTMPPSGREQVRLAAIVVPLPSPGRSEVRLRCVEGVEAVALLAGFPRLLGWRHQPTALRQFDFLADLVAAVPIYTADLPWGPPFSPRLAPELLEAIGLPAFEAGER